MDAVASRRRARPLWQELFDLASVLAFAALWTALALRLAGGAAPGTLAIALLAAVPAGVLSADLASGVAHWWADSFLDESTPLLGPLVIRPFREHHRDPQAMARHGFLEISGNNCLVCVPPLALAAALPDAAPGGLLRVVAEAALLVAALGAVATNHFHKWAHCELCRVPRIATWLQARGLILSPERHALHHGGDHDRAYCVTTGWWNPLVDRLGILPLLARRLRRGARG